MATLDKTMETRQHLTALEVHKFIAATKGFFGLGVVGLAAMKERLKK